MTTLTESFNKADADTLGPDQTWVEDSGDTDVVSNKAEAITAIASAFVLARISSSLATDNHFAQAKVESTAATESAGIIARKIASATHTFYLFDAEFGSNVVRLYRCVTNIGDFTSLGADVATTLGTNTQYTLKLECSGSAISTSIDGVAKHSVTDSNITGNLQVGIRCSSSGKKWDDFIGEDIVLPPGPITAPSLNCWQGGFW
jgi:hypothetical protein